MNSLVTLEISGKDVRRFCMNLYHQGFSFYHLEIKAKEKRAILTLSYSDYLKLKEIKTIYQIRILHLKGMVSYLYTFHRYRIFLVSLLIGVLFLIFLSHLIFRVEVVHASKEVRDFLTEELKKKGISKYSFVVSFKEKERVIREIMTEHSDYIEWMDLTREGCKYEARIEVRKTKELDNEDTPRDLIAKKKGMILSIEAESGEVLKKVNDYVSPGDVIVSGAIYKKEEIKDYIRAKGKVFAETWYHVTVEVPLVYQEVTKTGRKKNALEFHFLNHQWKLFSSFKHSSSKPLFTLENALFPFGFSYTQEEETEVIDMLYTHDVALKESYRKAREKLLASLGDEDEITFEKGLQIQEKDSKMIVEIFFKVKEDITSYIPIQVPDANISN